MPLVTETRQLFNSLIANGSVRFNSHPLNAAGATVTAGKSYAYGAWAQIIATATITIDSWLCAVGIDTFSTSVSRIWLIGVGLGVAGSEVLLSEHRFGLNQDSAVGYYEQGLPYSLPRPIFVSSAANNRISGEAGVSDANTPTANANVVMGTRFRGLGT